MRNIEMKNVKLKASSSQSSLEDTRATIERIPTAMTGIIIALPKVLMDAIRVMVDFRPRIKPRDIFMYKEPSPRRAGQ
jgi:hypothetical protein